MFQSKSQEKSLAYVHALCAPTMSIHPKVSKEKESKARLVRVVEHQVLPVEECKKTKQKSKSANGVGNVGYHVLVTQ